MRIGRGMRGAYMMLNKLHFKMFAKDLISRIDREMSWVLLDFKEIYASVKFEKDLI